LVELWIVLEAAGGVCSLMYDFDSSQPANREDSEEIGGRKVEAIRRERNWS
jgi:hypothetical protein